MKHRSNPRTVSATGLALALAVALTGCSTTLKGPDAFGDYKADKPGVTRRIAPADLPAPNSAESVRNNSQVSARPADAAPQSLPGFVVSEYSDKLAGPRALRVAPNGDVFVSESDAGRVSVLRPGADGAAPPTVTVFAEGLQRPFGIEFYPADNPQWVYVAESNAVVRFPYRAGDLKASGGAQRVVTELAANSNGHWTRDIVFSRDGSRMFVSIGSQSNFAADLMEPKTPAQLQEWEREHGLGGAWGAETGRAAVISFTPEGKERKVFATGIRNCVGLNRNPTTGDLYCTTNERDALGNNLVPDYLTRVREGQFYGWPWYYIGSNEEPRLKGQRPDLNGKVAVPDVLFQAHSAALQTTFYPAHAGGTAAFPAEYSGDAFVALHGSWNRAPRTGYKVVRVKLANGVPTGEYEDFLTGFVIDEKQVWGRPVGVAVLKDGSLLVSDDGGNKVWRVAYGKR